MGRSWQFAALARYMHGMEEPARLPPGRGHADDDAMIVRAIRAGDAEQFAALFRRYYEGLVTFARATTHADESGEEVVDDVFIRLWTNRESWAPQRPVRMYLYRAVRNQAISVAIARTSIVRTLERAIRHSDHMAHPVAMGTSTGTPEERLVAREHDATVQAAIAAVGDQARMLMVLRWDQGMSWTEVADVLGLSVEAAHNEAYADTPRRPHPLQTRRDLFRDLLCRDPLWDPMGEADARVE